MVHEPVISIQSDEKIIKKSVYLFILDIQDRGEIKQICDINNQKMCRQYCYQLPEKGIDILVRLEKILFKNFVLIHIILYFLHTS